MYQVFALVTLVLGGFFIKDYVARGGKPILFALLFTVYAVLIALAFSRRPIHRQFSPVSLVCGKQSPIPENYTVVGNEAYPGKWPWMAYISKRSTDGSVQESAGFLISDRWIVTCAHTNLDTTATVTLGVFDLGVQETTRITATVEKVVLHPFYSKGTTEANYFINDIALVKLTGPVTFTRYIYPVCLPTTSSDTPIGTLFVSNWGLGKQQTTYRLTDTILSPRAGAVCANFSKGYSGAGQLCFGNSNAADCSSDPGVPVVVERNRVWYAIGMSSYGYCSNLVPSVYVNIAHYLNFIKTTVAAN